MPSARPSARAALQQLRAVGKLRPRRGPLLRPAHPDGIALEYFKALRPLAVDEPAHAMRPVIERVVALLAEEREEERARAARGDAAREDVSRAKEAERLIKAAAWRTVSAMKPKAAERVAAKYGKRTVGFQREQFSRFVKAAVGVDYSAIERPVRDLVPLFSKTNADLIRTVAERYHDRVARDVREAFAGGTHPETLARQLAEAEDIALNDARRIARDQIGKLNAQVTQERQESLGVEAYIWRTVNDERVRDEHREREGQTFRWDEPPEDGHPGEPIQCFPGDTPARLFDARVLKAYRRWYSGELTTLVMGAGEALRCTPNHPILTAAGWKAAHLVEVGEDVFEAPAQGLDPLVVDPERRDSTMDEIFGAASALGITHLIGGGATGFHGDGSDEQVDVVDVDGCLGLELDPACSQGFCQDVLTRADNAGLPVGHSYLALLGDWNATDRVMRGASKILALVGREASMAGDHALRAVAWLDAIADELRADGCAADAEALRERLHTFPVGMEPRHHLTRVVLGVVRRAVGVPPRLDTPSAEFLGQVVTRSGAEPQRGGRLGDGRSLLEQPRRVVKKLVGEYSGHVFNLETSSGWYVTRGLIVRNCRCYPAPVLDALFNVR
jgi:SPP1 gp7 family putative phage head morphogenesis protein